MIAHLEGLLRDKSASRLVVDIGGVGYEILIPFSTYYGIGDVGETVSLRIYTHVKEDILSLYGFLTGKEKILFVRLIQVSGIGPKLGIAILSGLPVDEFIEAIMGADVVKLNGIPGVGKKTAERLVLELKDKVVELFPEAGEILIEGVSTSVRSDLNSALVNLGYPKKAVSEALKEDDTNRFEEILRKSLRKLRSS